jgi:hypothetical protein
MAKQVGPLFFTGTIDGIIFYKVGDKYYSRSKGSYKSAKHMRRNHKYKRTMEKANQFGGASKITKEVYYRFVPKESRKQGVYGQLTGMVNGWLQEGKSREEALALLITYCQSLIPATASEMKPRKPVALKASVPTAITLINTTIEDQIINRTPQNDNNAIQSPVLAGSPIVQEKKARFLSHWKVKHNGSLHIPIEQVHFTNSLSMSTHPYRLTLALVTDE